MFYLDIQNQLYFLIVVCFSFLTLVSTLCFSKESNLIRMAGSSMFIPFFLGIVSFLSKDRVISNSLLILGDSFLPFALFLLFALKPKEKYYSFLNLILYSLPVAAFFLVFNLKFISTRLEAPLVNTLLFVAGAVINMFIFRKQKGVHGLIFWSMLCLLGSSLTRVLFQENILYYIFLVLKFIEYLLLFIYFYRMTYNSLIHEIMEAQTKLSALDKSLNYEVKKRTMEIERSNEKLANLAKTDALTKALNKAAVIEIIKNLIVSKSEKVFSILMFDIDNFKMVNDTLGHVVGDKCIKKLAITAQSCIRNIDSLGRYGGDEFLIVLPGVDAHHAKMVAEKFRKKVDESEAPHFTVSIGVASYPSDSVTVNGLISIADGGLYVSKSKGRNRVSHKNSQ